ncbi:hypothetical protein QBC47DRAFT_438744 [Echria macrotheca]|uniref:Uncharacterized protein n=1 Tax=Echria macrotheca TaxID=438768 RepID=A0AAJ0B3B2_9PEZI|nr:hypothetical protein QBC47DRAFT_438744 [Echria macrotheca]
MPQRVAIVTGAASGIGRALVTRLVEKDWLVALVDINEEAGDQFATTLGPNATFYKADVSSYESQASVFSAVFAKHGRIDALCANAGIVDRSSLYLLANRSPSTTVDAIPSAPDLSATEVDLKGVIYGIRLATHFMRFNPPAPDHSYGKKIVVTASIAGLVPHPALPEYSAAKAGVVGFVRAVAPVLKVKEDIALSAVCPGLAATAVLPGVIVDAVGEALLTPVRDIVKAYEALLDVEGLDAAGEVREVVGERSDVVGPPRVQTDLGRDMYAAAMEPIFTVLHEEESGIDTNGMVW